jgi:hypothetical protein
VTLGDVYRDASVDLTRVGDQVHREILDEARRRPIARNERLGPSLFDPRHRDHVWRVSPTRIVWGTRVEYSRAHERHRRDRGQPSQLSLSRGTLDAIARIIGESSIEVDRDR